MYTPIHPTPPLSWYPNICSLCPCLYFCFVNKTIITSSSPPILWPPDTKSWEKTLMLGKTEGRRRRGDRGWDGWMAWPTRWTWVWASSRRWWRTGKPGMLPSMGSQRAGHDWVTEQQNMQAKVMLKILQARLQQYMIWEIPGVQAGFRKDRGTRDQIAKNPLDHRKSKEIPEKYLLLLHWQHKSFWLCRSQHTGKFLKRWEYQTTLPVS